VTIGNDRRNSAWNDQDNWMNAVQFTASTSGTVDLAEINVVSGTGRRISIAIYSDLGNNPGNRLSTSQEIRSNLIGWNTTNLNTPVQLVAGQKYWLCFNTDGSALEFGYQSGSGLCKWKGRSYTQGWPTTFGTLAGSNGDIFMIRAKNSACK